MFPNPLSCAFPVCISSMKRWSTGFAFPLFFFTLHGIGILNYQTTHILFDSKQQHILMPATEQIQVNAETNASSLRSLYKGIYLPQRNSSNVYRNSANCFPIVYRYKAGINSCALVIVHGFSQERIACSVALRMRRVHRNTPLLSHNTTIAVFITWRIVYVYTSIKFFELGR